MLFERSQSYWNGLLLLLTFSALALLWSKRRSVLDLWLMVVMCGLVIELCLIFLVGRRYVVGWYAARVYFLISATLVLMILLSETAFSLCAPRSFRDGGKSRTGNATDDDGRIIGLNRARDESALWRASSRTPTQLRAGWTARRRISAK